MRKNRFQQKNNKNQWRVGLLCGLLLSSLALVRWADQKSPADTRIRTIDVRVTKDGRSVQGLSKSDFSLVEDGRPIDIFSVDFVPSEKMLPVIFHDPSFWPRNANSETEEIVKAVAGLAEQGYEIAVLRLDWQTGLNRIENYTSDPDLVRSACLKAMEKIGFDKSLTDLGGQVSGLLEKPGIFERSGDQAEFRASLDIQRYRFERAAGGILTACGMLNPVSGNKSFLLISSGIPDLSTSSQEKKLSETATSSEILDAIHPRDQEQYGNIRIFDPYQILKDEPFERTDQVLQELVNFANTQNISVYALEPGTFVRSVSLPSTENLTQDQGKYSRLQSEVYKRQLQNIRLVAEKTGANFFRGADKYEHFAEAFKKNESWIYRLSFRPRRQAGDNKIHKIKVKTSFPDAHIETIERYKDYTAEKATRLNLVSAYYNPEFFSDVPFDADFVSFLTEDGSREPWINLSIPKEALFPGSSILGAKNIFHLHFWIRQFEGKEEGFRGELRFPVEYNESLENSLLNSPFLRLSFKGQALPLKQGEHRVTLALVDGMTLKIGTWETDLIVPETGEDGKAGEIFNCVMGVLTENPEKKEEAFVLDKKTGALEYEGIRFFPLLPRKVSPWQDVYAFIQVYAPNGPITVQPEIMVENQSGLVSSIKGKLVAQSYGAKIRVWSSLLKLDMFNVFAGDNTIQVKIPISEELSLLGPKIDLFKSRR